MEYRTNVKMNQKFNDILNSVIGQMSDGIWENTRSMERYWRNLSFRTDENGYLIIISRSNVCADPVAFLANKIKQIIKVEIEDGNTSLVWDRSCKAVPDYLDRAWGREDVLHVTVGDCYKLYEMLKGRDISKHTYASYELYIVEMEVQGQVLKVQVNAINEYDAKRAAKEKILDMIKVVKVTK